LSPNKGIEYVLKALPSIIATNPDVVFIVVGQTHPNLIRNEGEQYRLRLKQIAQELRHTEARRFFQPVRRTR
jgi:glycosyltransferase involved in cell wall biosynthesis